MHLSQKIKISFVVILLFFLISCSEKEEEKYIVKVGDSVLTEQNIAESIKFTNNTHQFREEFIREWIEKEVIYLDAKNSGILESDEYKKLIEKSKIEIANALVIKKMISENSINISDEELEKFYSSNIEKFKVATPFLIFNQIAFSDRNLAVEFSSELIKSNWEIALSKFEKNEAVLSIQNNKIEYVYNLLQENLREEFETLTENQFSRIVEVSENSFIIVQLLKRYNKNDVPKYKDVKEEVEQKYLSLKQKELYDNYLNKLYSEYSSVIVR